MSTSNLRVIAAGVAAIVAVLTGIVAGWVGAHTGSCSVTQTQSAPSTQPPGQGLDKRPNGGVRPTAQEQAVDSAAACTQSSFSVQTAAVGFVGAALAGGVTVALLFLGRREEEPTGVPVASAPPAAGADPGRAEGRTKADTDRSTLVQTCVYVRDRATSKAIADTLGRALAEVGVSAVAPVGARFDPAHHEAGGTTRATDPAQVGTIAAVEVPGYVDHGVVLRAPVVTVYREETAP